MIDVRFVPLTTWPGQRTSFQKAATFRASYQQTLTKLEYELNKLAAKEIVVQAFFQGYQIRNDGWPYATAKPTGSGVILSFRTRQGALSFPCDRYDTMDDNLRAIALSLEALRAVDRYGVTKRAEQYQGWKQIDAPPLSGFASAEDAAAFIITQQEAVPADPTIKVRLIGDKAFRTMLYRSAASRLHPDKPTGNHDLFVKLQQALAMLEAA